MTITNVAASDEAALWDGTTRGYIPSEPLTINPSLRLHQGVDVDVDPVSYEVVRSALANINQEHADMLQRLSLSPVVMLARDFQASLLTENADLVSIGAGVVYFSNQNALTIKYILEHFEEDEIGPGDMFLANDPYIGSAHQSDVTDCPRLHRRRDLRMGGQLDALLGHRRFCPGQPVCFCDRCMAGTNARSPCRTCSERQALSRY